MCFLTGVRRLFPSGSVERPCLWWKSSGVSGSCSHVRKHGACVNLKGILWGVYVVNKVLSQKINFLKSTFSPSPMVMRVMTKRMRLWIQMTKISFFLWMAPQGQSEELRGELLLLCIKRIQLRWLKHFFRCLPEEVFRAGVPLTLGTPCGLDELEEVTGAKEVRSFC